jgi:hypothetical protein
MGMIHPLTDLEYWYDRSPMGLSNFTGIIGRFGGTCLCLIIDNCRELQGCEILNHPLSDGSYNPRLSEGRVLLEIDGSPALLIWIHVDYVFVHGPMKEKLMTGLKFIMGISVRLGFIYKPIKTSPLLRLRSFVDFYMTPHMCRASGYQRTSSHGQEL